MARDTTLVQFFLGDPQGYQGPEIRFEGGADALRAAAEAAGVDLYVHAPYIVNVATTNNRIRIPSRKLLQQHMDAAASIGAKGLIVHGGHVNKDDDPSVGFDNWRKAIEATDLKIPLLIENTAGGDNAMARHLDRIAGVWDAISVGRGLRQASGSASTPATPGRAASSSATPSTRSAPSRAASTSSTPTTRATPSTPAPTGTPTSATGTCPPTSSPAWSARPGHRSSARRRVAPRSTSPTSRGCASTSESHAVTS